MTEKSTVLLSVKGKKITFLVYLNHSMAPLHSPLVLLQARKAKLSSPCLWDLFRGTWYCRDLTPQKESSMSGQSRVTLVVREHHKPLSLLLVRFSATLYLSPLYFSHTLSSPCLAERQVQGGRMQYLITSSLLPVLSYNITPFFLLLFPFSSLSFLRFLLYRFSFSKFRTRFFIFSHFPFTCSFSRPSFSLVCSAEQRNVVTDHGN